MPAFAAAAQVDGQADQFVERALEVGLDHEVLSGWDDLGQAPKVVRDWVQTGIALGDVDGDGLLDVVALGGALPNQVLIQQPDGRWESGPGSESIRSGEFDRVPALGDYDRDGDLDLFVGVFTGGDQGATEGRSRLYDNAGDGTFVNVTPRAAVRGSGRTLHALWYDLDLDGWLDLYLSEFSITPNRTYRNNADLTFADVTEEWALTDLGSAHATAIFDSDGNGWSDVFVGNDHWVGEVVDVTPNYPDSVHAGSGPGVFADVSLASGADQASAIMGIAVGDVNYDGALDLYKTDIGANWLLVNNSWPGLNPWVQSAGAYGVRDEFVPFLDDPGTSGWTSGWAAAFVDVNLDSWIDLWVVNGHVAGVNPTTSFLPRDQANSLFLSSGPENNFYMNQANAELGLLDNYDDRAGAAGDFDNDGDIDLAAVATAGRLRYFENELDREGRGFLKVRVDAGTSGPAGIGSQVRWVDDLDYPHVRPIGGTGPTAAQNEYLAHFGLGLADAVDVEVALQSGITLSLPGVAADSDLVVVEPRLFGQSAQTVAAGNGGPDTLPSQVTLAVFAHDSAGEALDDTANVSIEVPGANALGPVTHVGANRFERTFAAPAEPGLYRAEVAIDGWVPAIVPVVRAVGAVDAERSKVVLSTEAVQAGSNQFVTVVVTPRDANGLGLGSGRAVTVDVSGFAPVSDVVDNGDGTYRRTFRAAPVPVIGVTAVEVDGLPLVGEPRVDAGGVADANRTEVTVLSPYPHHAASSNQIKLMITPRDSAGRRLGSAADVSVSIVDADVTSTPGLQVRSRAPLPTAGPFLSPSTVPVAPGGSPTAGLPVSFRVVEGIEVLAREDGSHIFVLEKLAGAPASAGGSIEVAVGGALLTSEVFSF